MKTALPAAAMMVLLAGCVTYGNKTIDDPQKFLNIKEGKSTKTDVYAVFGQPHDVAYADDKSHCMWIYFKVETSPTAWSYVPYIGLAAGGTNEESTKVYFTFDSNQRLTRMQTTKKSDSENSWAGMARAASQGNRDGRAQHVAEEMAKIGKPFRQEGSSSGQICPLEFRARLLL
jgi:outer membrane protein assembly factor BamE (lipoprotein component of BamABCDE complex)